MYNVKALIDTFVEKFNETSKIKSASKLDPSKATYDRENVIADSLGNDYDRNKSVKITGGKNDNAILAQLIEKAKEDFRKVAASVKQSLIAEGVPIVGWVVAAAGVALSVLGMTTNIFGAHWGQHNANAGFYCEEKSHSSKGRWGYDTATLVNVFLAKVDAKVAEEKEKERQKHNPETASA